MSDPKPAQSPIPPQILAALGFTKRWFAGLSRPARVMFAVTTGLAVIFCGLVAFDKANEPYTSLFSQLDRDDASAIIAKLKELKVPFRIEADGSSIEVPESKARELRLELAGGGLPRGGGVGFESFDKMRLGATDFEQRVLYRRALEGELTRTIGTLGSVESSRVHLVLPEKSVFVARSEPASASIVLRLHAGRTLAASEVGAIVHLVSAAVPSLDPDHIAVVTTDGTTLHRPRRGGTAGDDDLGGDDDARSLAHSYETSVEDRVRAMLEKVMGPGRADVRVTAEIDAAHVEHIEEHFDPSRSALRSEEQSTEHAATNQEDSVAGVPGAESNLPNGSAKGSKNPAKSVPAASASASASATAPTAPVAVAAGSVRESHTRNFEVDKVSEKRVSAGGSLKRLTVAVVLDQGKAGRGAGLLAPEELEKLAMLVRSAAGANEARGDLVTVESIPFADGVEGNADPVAVVALPETRLQLVKHWGPYAAAAIVVLLVAGVALRRARPRSSTAPVVAQLAPAAAAPSALEAAIRPTLDSGDLRTRAHSRASQDPATAALVLRFWLGTSAPDPREPAKA